ncbi:hypothetical protein WJX77_009683 [Trebouxia sp. C0004]
MYTGASPPPLPSPPLCPSLSPRTYCQRSILRCHTCAVRSKCALFEAAVGVDNCSHCGSSQSHPGPNGLHFEHLHHNCPDSVLASTRCYQCSVHSALLSISAGSVKVVKVANTVTFLSGDSFSSSKSQSALTRGNTASIFGTSFQDVAADTQSVTTTTPANPTFTSAGKPVSMSLATAAAGVAILLMISVWA